MENNNNKRIDNLKKLTNFCVPKYILLDFEYAAIKSLKEAFLDSRVEGCIFHFGQAIWRKIGEFGLASEYINNKRTNSYFRMFLSLAFVPVEFVEIEYEKIISAIKGAKVYDKFFKFIIYLKKIL